MFPTKNDLLFWGDISNQRHDMLLEVFMNKTVPQKFENKFLEVKLQLNQLSTVIFSSTSLNQNKKKTQKHTNSERKRLQRNCDLVFETIYQTLDMPNFY